MLRNLALRPKLVLIIMLVSAVALVLLGASMVCFDLITLRSSLSHDLATVAEILGGNSMPALSFGDNRAASEMLSALQADPRVAAACMYTYDGKPFAKYVRGGGPASFVPPPVRGESSNFASGRLLQFHEIRRQGQIVGTLFIESDLVEVKQRLWEYTVVVGLVMLVSSLFAYVLASRLQNMFSRPVLELVQTAEQISKENNYALRAAHAGKDEFGLLVIAFNEMLGQIQRRDHELESQQAELQREVEARTAINLQLQTAKGSAETANKAKSEFLANMSHEIRTPINGILGMIELALGTQLTAEQREYLVMGRSSGESLLAIINDILDFSKIESGKLEVESIAFNLYNTIGEAMKMLAVRAHQKKLELLFDVDPQVPPQLLGDPGRLRQVLINLVGNAIKFTERGEVIVEINVLPKPAPEMELQFKVTDTGIGIARQTQALLFQAFRQADGSITRKYGGTGLGLAISARLVELMGGKLSVESTEAKGSIFQFNGKFSIPAAAPSQSRSHPRPELLGLRLLVVDDSATNRRIIQHMTIGWGMRPILVASVSSAMEALQRAHREDDQFRVVLLDADLPEINRVEFAALLRNHAPSSQAVILMLSSGASSPENLNPEIAEAISLWKPILETELCLAIAKLMDPGPRQLPVPVPIIWTKNEVPRKLHILVAEDNPINQTLMVRLLQKMGHSSVLAKDGKQALDLVGTQKFDLVLMDVQMPEVDGFTATSTIRKAEKLSGSHLPIFAITARAMKGDRELCLKAGMDGYISKPVNFVDLEKALATVSSAPTASVGSPAWTANVALERLDGDEELLREVCCIFLRESPKLLVNLKQAITDCNSAAAHRAAHSIKGEVGCLGAERISKIAKRIEQMAEDNDLPGLQHLVPELDTEMTRLYTDVKEKMGVYQ